MKWTITVLLFLVSHIIYAQENTSYLTKKPANVKGIYLSGWTAATPSILNNLITVAQNTEVNAFVIDMKDVTGYLTYRSKQFPNNSKNLIKDLPALANRLRQNGIYPIARITVFKDKLRVKQRPDLAVKNKTGSVWSDNKHRKQWLNPYKMDNWEYHTQIAKEVIAAGFMEIQWDYVRFPDASKKYISQARYPGKFGKRVDAITGFLKYTREQLPNVQISADVFGFVTSNRGDLGIGQHWEDMLKYVDVLSPMVYPSHYPRGSYGIDHPNSNPYTTVYKGLKHAINRSASADQIRPYLQAFTMGKPVYTAKHVRAQIKAAHDLGIEEWILWSPRNRYLYSYFKK